MDKYLKTAAEMLAIALAVIFLCQGYVLTYAGEVADSSERGEETRILIETSDTIIEDAVVSTQTDETVFSTEMQDTAAEEYEAASAESEILTETEPETENDFSLNETAEENVVNDLGEISEVDLDYDTISTSEPDMYSISEMAGDLEVPAATETYNVEVLSNSETETGLEETACIETETDLVVNDDPDESNELEISAENAEKPVTERKINEGEGLTGDIMLKGASSDAGQLQKDADGLWRLYKNGVFQSGFNGIVRYNGGDFFVANGLLCKNANGLNLWDSVWYYLSQGQIQRQHNGFAEYNKNWFMIKNGELEETANGLYPYDGSRFLFSVGRLRRDVNGLWQSQKENKWYYLSGGQVTKHTGIASYDGEFFKVNNGVLQTDYTGAVVYEGATFRVAKGQLCEKVYGSALGRAFSDGLYQIASAINIFKVVDVANGSKIENANVQLYDVNDTAAQKFRFIYDAVTLTWKILNANSGAALTAEIPTKSTAAANVKQAKWVTGGNQKWIIRLTNDGNYTLINSLTGRVLDIAGGRMTNGTNIQTFTSNGSNAQKFRLFQTDLNSDWESTATKNVRNRVANRAISYLGCNEYDGSHRQIIDLYNSHWPLAVGYYVTYTDDWCDAFVSAISIAEGLTDIFPTECGCERHINLFRQLGSWVENDEYVPKVGDLIFYDWEDSGFGENYGTADHVGIVTARIGNYVRIIEGNKEDAVGFRTITINQKNIRGYAAPAYWLRT